MSGQKEREVQHDTESEIKIPVMFGDGRVRYVGYEEIQKTHSPNLIITEIDPLKQEILLKVSALQQEGKPVEEEKVHSALALIDRVVVEAAETLAKGNGFEEQMQVIEQTYPEFTEMLQAVVRAEAEVIRSFLPEYAAGLRLEGKEVEAERLDKALEKLG